MNPAPPALSSTMIASPAPVFVVCCIVLWLSAYCGTYVTRRSGKLDEDERLDVSVILTAALALLGLIIGFTFSMATTRYNQRKDLEAAEANAVSTELTRAALLPPGDADRVRGLLQRYLKSRVLFYVNKDEDRLREINRSTAELQTDLWAAIQEQAVRDPTPLNGLVISGMNDVFNSQALVQASWWNRIPLAAWTLMAAIAIACNYLLGYTARRPDPTAKRLLVLPLIVAISFFLIADIDSPQGGVIRIHPRNLERVLEFRMALIGTQSNRAKFWFQEIERRFHGRQNDF